MAMRSKKRKPQRKTDYEQTGKNLSAVTINVVSSMVLCRILGRLPREAARGKGPGSADYNGYEDSHRYNEETEIIARDRYEFIQICILYKKTRLCSITDKLTVANASCNASRFGSDPHLNLTYTFTHKLAIQTLTPGVYIFTCKAGPDSRAVVSRRLLIERYAPRLDCSARSRFIRIKPIHSLFPICCLRIPTRADWIRDLKRPIDWCLDHLTCVSPYNRTRFDRGNLYFPELSDIMSGAITIRCHDAEYEEEHYLIGLGTSGLMIHVQPNHSVLFVQQHKSLAFCVGFPYKADCFDHRPEISPVLCTARQENVTISFKSRLQLTTEISEGTYDIKCHHRQTFLNKSTTVLVLHNGSFVWDCSMAPRIIYLESKLNSYMICRWKMNVSDKWKPPMKRLPHKYPSIYCRDNMRSLLFDGGVLLVNRSQRIQGVFQIFCREKLILEDLIITDRFSDLRLSIYPELTAIDKSVSGTLQARLEWRGATQHDVFQLRERFPINCSFFTMNNDSNSTSHIGNKNEGDIEGNDADEDDDKAVRTENYPPDIRIIVRPEQDFYLLNQEQPVRLRVSVKDETAQYAEILGSVRLNCTVQDPEGEQVELMTKPGDATTVHSYVSFVPRNKPYKSGIYAYACGAISKTLKLEKALTIVDPKEVTLIIKNRGKQIHYTGEVHNYICILEGPPVDAIRFQRHEPRWISRENSRSAGVWKNVLHVTEEASIGHYHYQCFYNKNGLVLHNELRFSVFGAALVRLRIAHAEPSFAEESDVFRDQFRVAEADRQKSHDSRYRSNRRFGFRIPHAGGATSFQALHYLAFEGFACTVALVAWWYGFPGISQDYRKDSKSDRRVGAELKQYRHNTTQDICTWILCSEDLRNVLFTCGIVKPHLQPLLREYPTGSSVQCVSSQQSVLHSLVEMTVVSDNLGRVTADRSSVVWFVNNRSYRVGEAYLACHLRATYMNGMYGMVRLIVPVRVLATERLFVSPNPVIDEQERVSCKTFSPISEKFSPVLILPFRMDKQMLTRKDSSVYEVDNQMQSGGHVYHCTLFLPGRSPQVLEDRISVLLFDHRCLHRTSRVWLEHRIGNAEVRRMVFWKKISPTIDLPQTTVLEEVTDDDEVIGWSCLTDGYPKEASTYQLTILEQPSNSFYQIDVNELVLTPYSVFGQITVQCIAKGVWYGEEMVVNGTHNLTYVGNDRMTAKHKALFQTYPSHVFYTLVLVSITFYFGTYGYLLRRTLKDKKDDQVPVNPAVVHDVILNIHEVSLGWADFGHLCSLLREFNIINKMCFILAENALQSQLSSQPTDLPPAEVASDHSLTISDSISTDSDVKGLYQDELLTLHEALMNYHDNRRRRSILLTGEQSSIRFSMTINEPLTHQVIEPALQSFSSQTERRQNE
ncbi:hypothetical protein CLF_106873 [Clonorchis sinensis]|uniref:Uncharacterized protein n=1 Tax=Clonorchis sinensis TaxID=79923 RepID=G7YFV4_CLOSI|nr:hypothetical protein CLF_106873 [Clonorchis sinensis]